MTADAPTKKVSELKPGDIYETATLGPIIVEEVKERGPDHAGFRYVVIVGHRP